VLLDGAAVQACQFTVSALDGAEVETIEALREAPDGNRVVGALTRAQAAQCGYCLPGIVVSAVGALRAEADPRGALGRNICRCGTHHRILAGLDALSRQAADG
jgi:aerobic-type carbon monoxide dehydrogenase small subunit (CoxS/CutS family)